MAVVARILSRSWENSGSFTADRWEIVENLVCVTQDSVTEQLSAVYSPMEIMALSGLPQLLISTYTEDSPLVCSGMDPTQDKQVPYFWQIRITWSTLTEESSVTLGSLTQPWTPPEDRPPEIWWENAEYYEPLEQALPGEWNEISPAGDAVAKPVVNTAGVPFGDPPVMVPRTRKTIGVRRYLTTWKLSDIKNYDNKLNATEYLGAAIGELRCVVEGGGFERFGGVLYHRSTIKLIYKQGGWQPKQANAGYLQLNSDKTKRIKILVDHDNDDETDPVPTPEPWPLNTNGQALPPDYAPGDVIYLRFRGHDYVDFAGMNLGLVDFFGTDFF